MDVSLLKKPSAWVPVALSLAMVAFILTLLSLHGIPTPAQNADEGVAAHLFQLWLVLEVFMIAFFAGTWLPREPLQALPILILQVIGVLAGCFPVFYFHL